MKSEDIKALAVLETNIWKAYYDKNFEVVLSDLAKFFEIQFNLSPSQAKEVTASYAKAAALFRQLPLHTSMADYQKSILPLLVNSYAILNSYSSLKDYERAAQFDLQWWADRRDSTTNSPEIVGQSMAKMYAAMNLNTDMKTLERAAYLRAVAGQFRDLAQHTWDGTTPKDWAIVEQFLLLCYQSLYQEGR